MKRKERKRRQKAITKHQKEAQARKRRIAAQKVAFKEMRARAKGDKKYGRDENLESEQSDLRGNTKQNQG